VPFGSIVIERTEKVSEADFPPLSVGKLGVTPQLAGVAKTQAEGERKLVRAGDLVINSRSDRRGASGLSRLDGAVSPVYTVMTPKPGLLLAEYGHHLLRSTAFQDEFFRWEGHWHRRRLVVHELHPHVSHPGAAAAAGSPTPHR